MWGFKKEAISTKYLFQTLYAMSQKKWGGRCKKLFWRGHIVVLHIKASWYITRSPEERAHFENPGNGETYKRFISSLLFFLPTSKNNYVYISFCEEELCFLTFLENSLYLSVRLKQVSRFQCDTGRITCCVKLGTRDLGRPRNFFLPIQLDR